MKHSTGLVALWTVSTAWKLAIDVAYYIYVTWLRGQNEFQDLHAGCMWCNFKFNSTPSCSQYLDLSATDLP